MRDHVEARGVGDRPDCVEDRDVGEVERDQSPSCGTVGDLDGPRRSPHRDARRRALRRGSVRSVPDVEAVGGGEENEPVPRQRLGEDLSGGAGSERAGDGAADARGHGGGEARPACHVGDDERDVGSRGFEKERSTHEFGFRPGGSRLWALPLHRRRTRKVGVVSRTRWVAPGLVGGAPAARSEDEAPAVLIDGQAGRSGDVREGPEGGRARDLDGHGEARGYVGHDGDGDPGLRGEGGRDGPDVL